MNHILTSRQFDRCQIDELIGLADIARKSGQMCSPMETRPTWARIGLDSRKVLATLFYEPSTRTRLSFEAAMCKLGGSVISTENAAQFSSAIKGETLEDSVRVVSSYADAIVLRHPERGAAQRAAASSLVPLINAGDGDGEHPTQALLDIYTVKRELGTLDGLHYCLVGDLKHGRTIHSLIYLLGLYKDVKLTLVSMDDLALPEDVLKFINDSGMSGVFTDSLPRAVEQKPDVVYMTRLQKERLGSSPMFDIEHHEIGYDSFQLTPKLMEKMKDKSIVLHPLPRRGELPASLDKDHRSAYFRQAENGLWMRAGILYKLMRE